jgi:hypothetical protein
MLLTRYSYFYIAQHAFYGGVAAPLMLAGTRTVALRLVFCK